MPEASEAPRRHSGEEYRRAGSLLIDQAVIGAFRRMGSNEKGAPSPVSLIPCSADGQRVVEKLCQVTWAWNLADRSRVAYRQRLCVTHFCSALLTLDKPWSVGDGVTCPACGIDTADDMDPVYATAFVPGTGKVQFEFALCPVHAAEVRVAAQVGAERLEDRQDSSRGQAPSTPPPAELPWAALGLTIRE